MYQLTTNTTVVFRIDDGMLIPKGHPWWDDYEAWLADGGVPSPVVVPTPSVPEQVSRYQARAALYKAGLLDGVEAVMDNPETDRLLVIAWQDAQNFERNSPMVLGLAAKLGLSAQQVDGLFVAAAAIE